MPEDHKGQREALTDDVDGCSGGEDIAAEPISDQKVALAKQQQKTLKDSAAPVIMVAVLLLAFGALAAVSIFVVTQAFQDVSPPALPETGLKISTPLGNATRSR